MQGLHEEQDKLAPEWGGVLQQLEQQRAEAPLGANATSAAVAAAAARLPVATRWDAASGQLLVAATVSFPGLAVPVASRGGADAEAAQRPQARRIALQRQQQDAGAAAATDWGPLLRRRFGATLRRAGPDAAVVLAAADRLPEVLEWLSQRPAVHWVAPAPQLRLNNARASVISQVRPGGCRAQGLALGVPMHEPSSEQAAAR